MKLSVKGDGEPSPVSRIYIADVRPLMDEALFARYYGTVSARRKEKIDRMRLMEGKCLSLGVEVLLQQACREFGINYREAVVEVGEYEKPYFAGSGIHFNLSHSGTRAMCIMSACDVGCDVEEVRTPNLRIAKRFFSPAEAAQIAALTDSVAQAELFYRIWTLKESFIKCVGGGLSIPLGEFTILTDTVPAGIWQNIDDSVYSFGEYDPGDGYKYSWCVKGSEPGAVITVFRY